VSPVSVSRALLFALRHVWLVIVFPLVTTIALVTAGLRGERTWTAGGAFVPQASTGARSNLSGLAAQLGLSLGGASDAEQPLFYAELLRSREILLPVVNAVYEVPTDTGTFRGTLTQWYGASGTTPEARSELARRWLDATLATNPGIKTGIIRYSVKTRSQQLSFQIADRILARLNEFNLSGRQSRASLERQFAQERLNTARAELRAMEDRLVAFLARNRAFTETNRLSFEEERLRREINFRAQLVATLAEAYEQARLDEVRDIPAITILEKPALPARPDSRGTLKRMLVLLLTTGTIGVLLSLVLDFARTIRVDAASEDSRALRRRLTALWPWARRRPSPS
jgi:uncharacterized protein involved in exopolysaccharide biosynthesis